MTLCSTAYLLDGLREEDAAGALLGLQQLLHQHPVQRRDQALRHRREELALPPLFFFLGSKSMDAGMAALASGGFTVAAA